jgi:hypothetical protein
MNRERAPSAVFRVRPSRGRTRSRITVKTSRGATVQEAPTLTAVVDQEIYRRRAYFLRDDASDGLGDKHAVIGRVVPLSRHCRAIVRELLALLKRERFAVDLFLLWLPTRPLANDGDGENAAVHATVHGFHSSSASSSVGPSTSSRALSSKKYAQVNFALLVPQLEKSFDTFAPRTFSLRIFP